MIWLPETWRKERSVAWQKSAKRASIKAEDEARVDVTKFVIDDKFQFPSLPASSYTTPTPSILEYGHALSRGQTLNGIDSKPTFMRPEKEVVTVSLADVNVSTSLSPAFDLG